MTMKRLGVSKSFFACLMVSFLFVVYMKLPAFAAEEEDVKELSFNSVVEIESYEVEEGYIEAGKEATVNLTLHNANRRTAADSIVVSVSSTSGMVYPTYGNDNQFFVGTLEADGTATVSIPIVVNSSFNGEYVDFTCSIVYVCSGKQITNTSTMILPARDSNTIIVSSVDVSAHAQINNKSLLSVSYYNKSMENINDASLQITGNVSEATKVIDLGTVSGGKTYTEDCNIIFTESGDQTISIMLNYTDIDGDHEQLDLGTFKVNVADERSSTEVNNSGNVALKSFGLLISLLAVAAVVVISIIYIKKR